MIGNVENFIKQLRRKAFFFENPNPNEEISKKFGFKFNLTPWHCSRVRNIVRNIVCKMVCNIEFNTGQNDFQKALMSDLTKIQSSKNVLVFADKATNLYEMSPDQYNFLLKNNITKIYRKTELITKTRIDKETRKLSKPLKLDNKMECYVERHVFISLIKDHKKNLKQNTKWKWIIQA